MITFKSLKAKNFLTCTTYTVYSWFLHQKTLYNYLATKNSFWKWTKDLHSHGQHSHHQPWKSIFLKPITQYEIINLNFLDPNFLHFVMFYVTGKIFANDCRELIKKMYTNLVTTTIQHLNLYQKYIYFFQKPNRCTEG